MLSRGYFVVALLVSFSLSQVNGMNGKCNIDDRVRIALRTMNSNTVPRVVDCVVGAGQCDDTGNWIRNHARYYQSSMFQLSVLRLKSCPFSEKLCAGGHVAVTAAVGR